MQTTKHFILMTREEFVPWLQSQKITRRITRLQVHHTWSPAYKDVKAGAELDRLISMRDYHVNRNGWNEIGQNITTFPSGLIGISRGRDLNKDPAGIRGANTGAVCVENLGNFDKGGDTLTPAHRQTILTLYAAMANTFGVPIDTEHIVYHAWYTSSGTFIRDYKPGESAKTCPGTNFFGDGNTKSAAMKSFIPGVQAEALRLRLNQAGAAPLIPAHQKEEDQPMTPEEKKAFDALAKKVEEQQQTINTQSGTIKDLVKRANLNADVPLPKWANEAVAAAKRSGAITTSADKSTDALVMIQMLFNLGLLGDKK